ncbi:Uncharacterized protein Clim_1224 [hydrothermal vent metagenome]|uniref:Uncharacterized protein Clim_1224 n=1 Tax=hydrothermal vent metagenome TaxID=652676 RepID=A0A3B1BWB6_9ZZZZ
MLDIAPDQLDKILSGPTLIHLPGRKASPLFVSALVHGNEVTGLMAIQSYLKKCAGKTLPRALSVFIGNVKAAKHGKRMLADQPDFNRIWGVGDTPESLMAREALEQMKRRDVFACIDIHNNTGLNPHYASVTKKNDRFFQLATIFSRMVVYYIKPEGTLAGAFSRLCPSVTVECGLPGTDYGVTHASEFIKGVMRLDHISSQQVHDHDLELYRTVAIVKTPSGVSYGFGGEENVINYRDDLDRLNFRELPPGTSFGKVKAGFDSLPEAWDENWTEVTHKYFALVKGEIALTQPVMPSMLTKKIDIIRQDCLCYFMERVNGG